MRFAFFFLGSLLPRWGLFAIPIFGLYELVALIAVQRCLVTAKDLPQAVWGFNVLLELCMPALALATFDRSSLTRCLGPSGFAIYPDLLSLAHALHPPIQPKSQLHGRGCWSVRLLYGRLLPGLERSTGSAPAHSTVEQSGVLIYGILILTSGLVAGAVAREMQKYMRAAVSEVETLFQVRLEERIRERTRIARELHDTLLQSFQGLLLRFQTVSTQLQARCGKTDAGQRNRSGRRRGHRGP